MGNEPSSTDEIKTEDVILGHIADYIIQVLIKEDVNAFVESSLLHELLVYKLNEVARPLMHNIIKDVSDKMNSGQAINVLKEVGGITSAKRISFRSQDQYNAFVSLFFEVAEEYPELTAPCSDEDTFEKFMVSCIYRFKDQWDEFAESIAREKMSMEHARNAYINRRKHIAELEQIPTYADFIAERIDSVAGNGPSA